MSKQEKRKAKNTWLAIPFAAAVVAVLYLKELAPDVDDFASELVAVMWKSLPTQKPPTP